MLQSQAQAPSQEYLSQPQLVQLQQIAIQVINQVCNTIALQQQVIRVKTQDTLTVEVCFRTFRCAKRRNIMTLGQIS